ncbi:hypothetical protein [Candidatus Caldatribacterium sp.]|uniref:hypothetical protein n=1 Tax=Candidatus Caldatribacterium sp. TaxID=2282143 RepID=UPI00383D01E1|nr:hypothetical protein [Candidatus Caldatribacterium sp.]
MLSITIQDLRPYYLITMNPKDEVLTELLERAKRFDLTIKDLEELNSLIRTVLCIYHLNESYLKFLKEFYDYLCHEEFGKCIDQLDLETTNPTLFNELLLTKLTLQATIENETTLTTALCTLSTLMTRALEAIFRVNRSLQEQREMYAPCVPENVEDMLVSIFDDAKETT